VPAARLRVGTVVGISDTKLAGKVRSIVTGSEYDPPIRAVDGRSGSVKVTPETVIVPPKGLLQV
jgi:hypothetical protein